MFKNDYFEVYKLTDDSVLIADREGKSYKWGEKAVTCYCPAHHKEISPFLMVKYSDNTWSLCHTETGPMPEATRIPEKEKGVCPIVFHEDFLADEAERVIKEGCLKKAFIGLLSLGAMLVGVETTFQKCSPVKNEEKSVQNQEQISEKSGQTQDTCTIVKAGIKDFVKDIKNKLKIKG